MQGHSLRTKSKITKLAIQRRLELRRWTRRLGSLRKRKARRQRTHGGGASGATAKPHRLNFEKAPEVFIDVPESIDLWSAHDSTCELVNNVVASVRQGNRVCLDFQRVTRIRPSALTYLLAAIHRLRLEHGDVCVTGTYPDSPKVERQLSESGFYRLLRVKRRSESPAPSKAVRYIEFKSEQEISGETIADLRNELLRDDLRMPRQIARTIFRALSEAMTNVNHHAYYQKSFQRAQALRSLRGRWWLMGSLHVPRNMFSIVFYDAGVGIPKTLPRTQTIEKIRQVLSLLPAFVPDDGQMIEAAMALGRTRTMLDNRGKGLLDLARLIDDVGGGEMRIYSRTGSLVYKANGSQVQNHRNFVEGTLIEWQLPLNQAIEALPGDYYEATDVDA